MFDLKTFLIDGPNVNLQIGFLHGKGIDIVFKIKKVKLLRRLGITPLSNLFPISGSSIFKIRIKHRLDFS